MTRAPSCARVSTEDQDLEGQIRHLQVCANAADEHRECRLTRLFAEIYKLSFTPSMYHTR